MRDRTEAESLSAFLPFCARALQRAQSSCSLYTQHTSPGPGGGGERKYSEGRKRRGSTLSLASKSAWDLFGAH
eukprot:5415570-Prymnesium_polylepis.2